MDVTLKGHLILERNPSFSLESATVGNNDIKELYITVFDAEAIKIRHLIDSYNPETLPIEKKYSFPVTFGDKGSATIKLKIRGKNSSALMKLIDWNRPALLKKPLRDWIGLELSVSVRLCKYDFIVTAGSDVIEGGAGTRLRGISFVVKSIAAENI